MYDGGVDKLPPSPEIRERIRELTLMWAHLLADGDPVAEADQLEAQILRAYTEAYPEAYSDETSDE